MSLASAIAIYFIIWWLVLFLVLPFGVRTTQEAGGTHVPGQAESAPHEFSLKRTALRVTIVATVLWALFVLNYIYGWITPDMLDLVDATNSAG